MAKVYGGIDQDAPAALITLEIAAPQISMEKGGLPPGKCPIGRYRSVRIDGGRQVPAGRLPPPAESGGPSLCRIKKLVQLVKEAGLGRKSFRTLVYPFQGQDLCAPNGLASSRSGYSENLLYPQEIQAPPLFFK